MRKFVAFMALAAIGIVVPGAFAEVDGSIVSVTWAKKKVMVKRGSGLTAATNNVELPDAVKVMTNGVFTVKGGKERRLREGQVLGADGMLTSPDGTVVPVADHFVMEKGRVMMVKAGQAAPAAREVVLGDGRRLRPDGTLHNKDGRIQRLVGGP